MKPFALVALLLWAGLAGCADAGRPVPRPDRGRALDVGVLSDTAEVRRLDVKLPPPRARVWLTRVEPSRGEPPGPPLPEATPEAAIPEPAAPPLLVVDERLRPPILRRGRPLAVPAGAAAERRTVELEVRVARDGRVVEARPVAGDGGGPFVRAAIDCALAMEFYPALLAGEPVEVWCRQRFDFGAP
jgi:outer membrane biosynthesis protein TonB